MELRHPGVHSPAGFEWGHRGPGATELAWSILLTETGQHPIPAVCESFRDEVIAQFPPGQLRLPADVVQEWLRANRAGLDGPAFAVADVEIETGGVVDDGPTASALVSACERAWESIQANHPGVPDAVIVLGTGVERGRLIKLGHWWDNRWLADGAGRGEVLLAGEALHLSPTEVFEVLLHEAAHGLNASRHIKDTSREGRYHNEKFKATAEEVGLRVHYMKPHAWARTSMSEETADRYRDEIDALGESMRITRQLRGINLGKENGSGKGGNEKSTSEQDREPRTRNGVPAACGCGRRMRIAPSVLAQGPVICGLCGNEFAATQAIQRHPPASASVDSSFIQRRHAALEAERETIRAWCDAWGTDHEVPLVGSDAAAIDRLNGLARTELKAKGMLHGPPVHIDGMELMAGDRVIAGTGLTWPDAATAVEPGVIGVVEEVDANASEVVIDFTIEGRDRFRLSSLGQGKLSYGYAVDEHEFLRDFGAAMGREVSHRIRAETTSPEPTGPELEFLP
jgi:hypothetical protein